MDRYFYICLSLEPYKNDEQKFRRLMRELNGFGIIILDADEVPLVDSKTKEPVYETLMLYCWEERDGAMLELAEDMRKNKGTENNIYEYNGLPMIM